MKPIESSSLRKSLAVFHGWTRSATHHVEKILLRTSDGGRRLGAGSLTHGPGAARRAQTELMNCGCGGDKRGARHGNQCLSGLNPKKALISPSSCRGGDSSRAAAQTQVRRRKAEESEAHTKAYVCILYNEVHFELNQATLLKKKNTLFCHTRLIRKRLPRRPGIRLYITCVR